MGHKKSRGAHDRTEDASDDLRRRRRMAKSRDMARLEGLSRDHKPKDRRSATDRHIDHIRLRQVTSGEEDLLDELD